jgi:hypothetical protein
MRIIKYIIHLMFTFMLLVYKPIEHKVHYVTYPTQYKLSATYYNNVKDQCDGSPHITADGTHLRGRKVDHLRYVAMSRDMVRPTQWHDNGSGYNPDAPFEFGDTIIVKNSGMFDGEWKIVDSMNERFKKAIDFLVSPSYIKWDSHSLVVVEKK